MVRLDVRSSVLDRRSRGPRDAMTSLNTFSGSVKAYVDETLADSGHQIAIDLGMKRPTEEGPSPSPGPEDRQQDRCAASVDDHAWLKAGQLVVASTTAEEASP